MASDLESGCLESPKGRIHYLSGGAGAPVVLIHGGGPGASGIGQYSRNVDPLLAAGRRVVVLDLPGFGGSTYRDTSAGLYVTMAEAVFELIEHLDFDTASLVGNSLGAATALQLTLDHPERFDRLVLIGAGGKLPDVADLPPQGMREMLTFYEGDGPSLEKLERVFDLLVFDRAAIPPELIADRLRAATTPEVIANPPLRRQAGNIRNDLWEAGIDRLEQPMLLVWGREDRVMPVDMALVLLRRLRNADLHVFGDCGHWAQWEKAAEFNRLAIAFLGGDR